MTKSRRVASEGTDRTGAALERVGGGALAATGTAEPSSGHEHRAAIRALGRPAGSALQVHDVLQRHPLVSVGKAATLSRLSEPTVAASFAHMQRLGIVREITNRQRNRTFAYGPYLDVLSVGTEPLAPDRRET